MPTYRITDDSGKTIRITGDSPPTQDELEAIYAQLQSGVKAKDSEPEELPGIPQLQAAQPSTLETLGISIGKGMMDVGRGLGIADPAKDYEKQAFDQLSDEQPIASTIGEVMGQAAPFLLPGTAIARAATLPVRAGLSAATGALEGGVLAKGTGGGGDEIIKSAGIGGAVAGGLEMALPGIGRVGGRLIRRYLGKEPSVPILDANGNPSPELQAALDKTGLSIEDISMEAQKQLSDPAMDVKATARKAFLQDQGLTPTRAQVSGDALDFQAQQELAKTSNKVRRALGVQDEILGQKFDNAITSTGGSANQSNSTAFDFIADRAIELDSEISAAYRAARDAAPTAKVVRPERLVEEVRKIAGSDNATGGLASATRDILRDKGVLGKKGLKVQGRVAPAVAEEIRIDLNSLHNSMTPLGKSKLRTLKNALDDDVAVAVGEDIFQDARAAKAKFESDLNRARVNKFDQRKKQLVRDILENKINPDRFLDEAVLSRALRGTDVKQLKDYLLLDEDAGLAAWNDLRAEAMDRIRNTAFKEVAGEAVLSRAGLEKALSQFGPQKLAVMFDGKEREFLSDMLKTAKIREPVRGTALGRGPSAQAIGRLENTIKRIPLLERTFEGVGEAIDGKIVLTPKAIKKVNPLPGELSAVVPMTAAFAAQSDEPTE